MAYMNQRKKAVIAEELKKVVPKDWRYTLRVENHRKIVCIIRSTPYTLRELTQPPTHRPQPWDNPADHNRNAQKFQEHFDQRIDKQDAVDAGQLLHYKALKPKFETIIKAMLEALNTGNWNRSDVQSDYFDVGHYVDLYFGDYGSPYKAAGKKAA